MQKDEICQPLRRKDHLQHMLSYESAEQDGKEDENLSAVQQAKVRRPFQRNVVWTVLQQNFIKKAAQKTRQCATCHETKPVHQFGTSTDCKLCYSKQYYRKKNQMPSAAQKEKLMKENGRNRKTRKSVKMKQADVPSEEDDDSEQEPISIKRKRKVTKTGGKRESKRLKAEQD